MGSTLPESMRTLPSRLRNLLWALLALVAVVVTDGETQAAAISPLEVALHRAAGDGAPQAAWVQPWGNGLPDVAEESLRESTETQVESEGSPQARALAVPSVLRPPPQALVARDVPAPHLRSAGNTGIGSGRPPPGRGWSERGPPVAA